MSLHPYIPTREENLFLKSLIIQEIKNRLDIDLTREELDNPETIPAIINE